MKYKSHAPILRNPSLVYFAVVPPSSRSSANLIRSFARPLPVLSVSSSALLLLFILYILYILSFIDFLYRFCVLSIRFILSAERLSFAHRLSALFIASSKSRKT